MAYSTPKDIDDDMKRLYPNRSGMLPSLGGKKKREEVYVKKFEQGYEFKINAHDSISKNLAKELQSQGFDVFIGKRAFWEDGHEDSNLSTILVKKTRVSTHFQNESQGYDL